MPIKFSQQVTQLGRADVVPVEMGIDDGYRNPGYRNPGSYPVSMAALSILRISQIVVFGSVMRCSSMVLTVGFGI